MACLFFVMNSGSLESAKTIPGRNLERDNRTIAAERKCGRFLVGITIVSISRRDLFAIRDFGITLDTGNDLTGSTAQVETQSSKAE